MTNVSQMVLYKHEINKFSYIFPCSVGSFVLCRAGKQSLWVLPSHSSSTPSHSRSSHAHSLWEHLPCTSQWIKQSHIIWRTQFHSNKHCITCRIRFHPCCWPRSGSGFGSSNGAHFGSTCSSLLCCQQLGISCWEWWWQGPACSVLISVQFMISVYTVGT